MPGALLGTGEVGDDVDLTAPTVSPHAVGHGRNYISVVDSG
jgi:hypothetical protein